MRDTEPTPAEATQPDSQGEAILDPTTTRPPIPDMYVSAETRVGKIETLVGQTGMSMNVSLTDIESVEDVSIKDMRGFHSVARQMASAAVEIALVRQHPEVFKKERDSKIPDQTNTVVSIDKDTGRLVVTQNIA